MQALAGVGASLSHYKWSGNKSAKRRTISIGVDPARRPDHLSYAEDATILAGEDKVSHFCVIGLSVLYLQVCHFLWSQGAPSFGNRSISESIVSSKKLRMQQDLQLAIVFKEQTSQLHLH